MSVLEEYVYVVEEYKDPGVHIYNKLKWKSNTEAVQN